MKIMNVNYFNIDLDNNEIINSSCDDDIEDNLMNISLEENTVNMSVKSSAVNKSNKDFNFQNKNFKSRRQVSKIVRNNILNKKYLCINNPSFQLSQQTSKMSETS